MQNFPSLHRIEIFPIKSLDGMTTDRVSVLPSGVLEGDRQFAIMDEQGQFVNGKSTPLVHFKDSLCKGVKLSYRIELRDRGLRISIS
jgi:uncharacterized protein YcbX